MLRLSVGKLCEQISVGIGQGLPVDMLLSTAFIDRLIRRVFPSGRKVVMWLSPPVAFLTNPGYNVNDTQNAFKNSGKIEYEVEKISVIRVPKQIVFKPKTQYLPPVTTNAHGLKNE